MHDEEMQLILMPYLETLLQKVGEILRELIVETREQNNWRSYTDVVS